MTREIKANYWDGKEMQIADIVHLCIEPNGTHTLKAWDGGLHEYFDLILYTGLKDKNGKEIYEGDIVSDNGQKRQIIFKQNLCAFVSSSMDGHGATTDFDDDRIEIIGNIYQNPELIK